MSKRNIVLQFGKALDRDEFSIVRSLLEDACEYAIGEQKLIGPEAIANSYESNMIEGRKKLDKLEWGQCKVEQINDTEFYVHFTDYLMHKGEEYTHRCKQKIRVGVQNKIVHIEHISDPSEQERLDNFYKRVGLK